MNQVNKSSQKMNKRQMSWFRKSLAKKIAIFVVMTLLVQMVAVQSGVSITNIYSAENATLTFSDSAIEETVAGTGYTISGTTLTITANGTYRVMGACQSGTVVVNKSLSNVVLIFENLTLSSSDTAPVVVKKGSSVVIKLIGTTTLNDNEDASKEDTNADFEGACIKVKSGSTLKITGEGTLNVNGNAKNGIKGAAETTFIMNSGVVNADVENNGIAFDGGITINGGTIVIDSENDGIKAVPDATDLVSEGIVNVNGGNLTIHAGGDGIQAVNFNIADGVFAIRTMDGYKSSGFDSDTMSCKGIKASGSETDTSQDANTDAGEATTSSSVEEDAEESDNTIRITGGTFVLNTIDDAIHSDGYVVITGGTFDIYTGDDGVHADTSLTLGTENGYDRDPDIVINASYEGLEAGTIYSYSGRYYVIASDDGVNAAGGSSNGTDPGQGGGNHFNPGGGPNGRGGSGNNSGGSGNNNGGFGNNNGFDPNGGQSGNNDYAIYIYGGKYYVNVDGDGIDSNGDLYLYGGELAVLAQKTGGDNSPLDSDGTILISGATVFAAGTNPMNETPASSGQKYYTATTGRTAGTIVNINYDGSVVYSEKLTKNINYLLYSSPDMATNSCTVTTSNAVDSCKSNSWQHNWNAGIVTTEATNEAAGIITYTCGDCGETELQSVPKLMDVEKDETNNDESDNDNNGNNDDEANYTVTFKTDSHASINIYYTQDYTTADEINVTAAVARDKDTGEVRSDGDGQINFLVVVEDGYEIASTDDIQISGDYKNLKEQSENLYRITKISSDLTVSITTTKVNKDSTGVIGDVNFDGSVDIADALLISRYDAALTILSEEELAVADVNQDGAVDIADALMISRYDAKLITEF